MTLASYMKDLMGGTSGLQVRIVNDNAAQSSEILFPRAQSMRDFSSVTSSCNGSSRPDKQKSRWGGQHSTAVRRKSDSALGKPQRRGSDDDMIAAIEAVARSEAHLTGEDDYGNFEDLEDDEEDSSHVDRSNGDPVFQQSYMVPLKSDTQTRPERPPPIRRLPQRSQSESRVQRTIQKTQDAFSRLRFGTSPRSSADDSMTQTRKGNQTRPRRRPRRPRTKFVQGLFGGSAPDGGSPNGATPEGEVADPPPKPIRKMSVDEA